MSVPENTSNRDPLLHLLGAFDGNSDGYITGMEAAGQRQFVASEVIPTEILHGSTEETLAELGFVLGEPVAGDPVFRQATLPAGWSKAGSDHDMWSYIVDELGRRRCSIFYKAAWYDRSAHMSVVSLTSYASSIAHGEAELILDDEWATREGMAAAFAAWEAREAEDAERWREHGASGNQSAAKYIAEHEQQQTRYAALRASLTEPKDGE